MARRSPRAAPRVTVGVPAYNAEKYLDEALWCLRRQTYEDLEVVISDNGSTDGTQEIAARHAAADPRIRYHRSEINRGLPWNFNRTLELATGEYFTWNSVDDRALAGHLAACVVALDAQPEAPLAFARVQLIDAGGHRMGDIGDAATAVDGPRPRDRVRRFLQDQVFQGIGYGGVFRTETLRAAGGLPGYYGGDLGLGVRLAMLGDWAATGEATYQWRRHPGQATNLQTADLRRQMAAMRPGRPVRLAFPAWALTGHLLAELAAGPYPVRERCAAMWAVVRYWSLPQWRAFPYDVKRNIVLVRQALVRPTHAPGVT